MKLPKYLTTVTPFSRALAMGLFIVLPFVGFWIGIKYQALNKKTINLPKQNAISNSDSNGSLQLTPFAPSPTSSYSQMQKFKDLIWKTYSDMSMGISFEYPNNLNQLNTSTLRIDKDRVILGSGMSYIFEVKKIVTNDSVEEWWSKNDSSKHDDNGLMPANITKTSFHNKLAYYFEVVGEQQVPSDYYIIPYPGYFLQISFRKVTPYRQALYSFIATNSCQSSMVFGQIDYDNYYRQFDDLIIQRILSSISFVL